jgi:hypothetical protein
MIIYIFKNTFRFIRKFKKHFFVTSPKLKILIKKCFTLSKENQKTPENYFGRSKSPVKEFMKNPESWHTFWGKSLSGVPWIWVWWSDIENLTEKRDFLCCFRLSLNKIGNNFVSHCICIYFLPLKILWPKFELIIDSELIFIFIIISWSSFDERC